MVRTPLTLVMEKGRKKQQSFCVRFLVVRTPLVMRKSKKSARLNKPKRWTATTLNNDLCPVTNQL